MGRFWILGHERQRNKLPAKTVELRVEKIPHLPLAVIDGRYPNLVESQTLRLRSAPR
jgi:hypothetical protein